MSTTPFIHPRGYKCLIDAQNYVNEEGGKGRAALRLIDAEDGSPVGIITVNIPEAHLGENEHCVKIWSENEGMLEAIINQGLATDTGRREPTGFVEAAVVTILPENLKKFTG